MITNPQKIIPGRYHVVPRTLILIIDEKKILLQKAAVTKKIWAGLYNGLGGHIERNEDVLTAARRELYEEAGIKSPDLRLYGTVMIDVDEHEGILMFVFCGRYYQGTVRASEEGSLEWVEIDDIKELPTVEDIPMIISKLRDDDDQPLFYGHYSYDEQGKLQVVFN